MIPLAVSGVANPLHWHRLHFIHCLSLLSHVVQTVLTVGALTVCGNWAGGYGHHLTLKYGGFSKLVQLQLIPLLSPLIMSLSCSVER